MDESFNSDVREALLIFVNRPEHKSTLRKSFDALPVPTDTAADVEQKILRHALLSNHTHGRWVVAPKDTEVRRTICKHGFLKCMKALQTDALQAMQSFLRGRGLPEMRSYNNFIIQQHILNSADPNIVGNVSFRI